MPSRKEQARGKGRTQKARTQRGPLRRASGNGRQQPRVLLHGAIAIAVGFSMMILIRLSNAPVFEPRILIPFAAYALAVAIVAVTLRAARWQGDRTLLATALLLGGIGYLIQFRLGSHDWEQPWRMGNHLLFLGMGLMTCTALVLGRGRHRLLETATLGAAFAAMVLLGIILAVGQRFRGMVFLPGNTNPSEIVKILLVIFLAGFMALHRKELEKSEDLLGLPGLPTLFPLVVFWGIPMVLLVLQRDLGMIVQLNLVFVVLWYVWTGRLGIILAGGGGLAAIGYLIMHYHLHGYRRLEVWLDPFQNPTGAGWQVLQSLSALYSGGLFGAGLGVGSPSAVPIATSDFVYAAVGEELGWVGCVVLLLVYGVLIHRAYALAMSTREAFPRLLVAGLATTLAVQVLLNVGGVTKALPLTGITLPFVSQGGSSLLTSFAMVGIMLAVSEPVKRARKTGTGKRRSPGKTASRGKST